MIIGIAMLVFSIIVVLIGTTPSEASVLYYDVEEVAASTEATEGPAETEEVYYEDRPAAEEEAPRMTVTVGGAAVNKGQRPASRAQVTPAEETVDDIRAAASSFDPNKAAQGIFDDMKGMRL